MAATLTIKRTNNVLEETFTVNDSLQHLKNMLLFFHRTSAVFHLVCDGSEMKQALQMLGRRVPPKNQEVHFVGDDVLFLALNWG